MKYHVHWFIDYWKGHIFKYRDGKYRLFFIKTEKLYLLDIFNFPWYSGIWEKWFLVQCDNLQCDNSVTFWKELVKDFQGPSQMLKQLSKDTRIWKYIFKMSLLKKFLADFSLFHHTWSIVQKQSSRGILRFRKRCSENMQQMYRRTSMPKCHFNKVAKQFYWNLTSAWVFSLKFAAYFQNTSF